MALYPRNKSRQLDMKLFEHPTSEYRGAPFWSWNTKVDLPQLLRQADAIQQMGFGGFNIHSRTGLASEYLGDEYINALVACTDEAAKRGMLSWLYDEDRWPSGYAGGMVTRERAHRIRHLLWTDTPYHDPPLPRPVGDYTTPLRTEDGVLLGRFEVVLDGGFLARYRKLKPNDKPAPGSRIWYAYLEIAVDSPWFNGASYVNTFSKPAIERFIETTHKRFAQAVGQHFGRTVPAIFTDEPQFVKKTHFNRADEARDLFMPWSDDFPLSLIDQLPELFWNLAKGKPSVARYRYHELTAERFSSAFGDTIGRWCQRHKLALTGHLLGEFNLFSQTRGIGEAMRPLRSFHIPGIDVLCDYPEYTTAKQAQSVARQFGREGVLSELYGVTNWDFDFIGHKAQGDWQAAMGVTVRVPHLAWVSMAGEAKRDYPASIGYQSPWFKEYPLIEDHFARVNTVMTRGKPVVRVGVIHPIESYWLAWGPAEHVQPEWERREEAFQEITKWLCFGGVDFDFISEGLLPSQSPRQSGKRFIAGKMKYDAVIVPGLRTIRSSTLSRLERFAKAGGTVIFAGEVPTLVDVKPSAKPAMLAKRCESVQWNRTSILHAVAPFRDVAIRHADGSPADSMLHQLRIDGKKRNLFVCNTDRAKPRRSASIRVAGKWDVTRLDTMTGQAHPIHARVENNHTLIPWDADPHGHLLVTLSPDTKDQVPAVTERKWKESGRLSDPVRVTLSEPNVLLLDQPSWRLDGGHWHAPEEILRIDNLVRERLKLPPRSGRAIQPWADKEPAPIVAQLQLKFVIRSDVHVGAPQLAIEDPETLKIEFNRRPVSNEVAGWWVDEAIKTVRLPSFAAGDHELLITIPFTRKTNVEWCYLLGNFGVQVAGRHAHLVAPVRELSFGDWTHQGLPFYAGNVMYHCTIQGSTAVNQGADTIIEVSKFRNPLLSVALDGKPVGRIAFAPFQLNLGQLTGLRKLDVTAYGNRVNAFGPLHNCQDDLKWVGPGAWRSTGVNWSYEYQLKKMGVLVAPTIRTEEYP